MTGHTWPRGRNIVSREELRENLERYSRDPFADVLEALLQARPSTERLLQWAGEHPDKWANAIKVFASLTGYTEKTEEVHTHLHAHKHIGKMSDAELLQSMHELARADPGFLMELKRMDMPILITSKQEDIP